MIEPLVKTVEVPCDQATAFQVFVEEMATWWPLDRFTVSAMTGTPAQTIKVDTRVGGKIIEVGPEGQEYLWGIVNAFDPSDFFAMDFHIPTPDEAIGPADSLEFSTHVKVRFTVLDEQSTKVELTQSNFEGLGPRGADIRGGYTHGLEMIICQAYKAACEAKA